MGAASGAVNNRQVCLVLVAADAKLPLAFQKGHREALAFATRRGGSRPIVHPLYHFQQGKVLFQVPYSVRAQAGRLPDKSEEICVREPSQFKLVR